MPDPLYYAKRGQQLSRQWKRGEISQEQFQIESLKLSCDMKEAQYLRAASELLDARKLLQRVADLGLQDAPDEPFYVCAFCGAQTQIPAEMRHHSDCLANEARAFLANENAAGE